MHHVKPDCPALKKDAPKVMKTETPSAKKEVVTETPPQASTSTAEPVGGGSKDQ